MRQTMNARMRDLLPAISLLIGGLVLSGGLPLSPHPGEAAIVAFSPSISGAEAFAHVVEAGWLPVASPFPFLILARPDGTDQPRRPAGAYLLLNAGAMVGCLPIESASR
jgi:hypothetical protein